MPLKKLLSCIVLYFKVRDCSHMMSATKGRERLYHILISFVFLVNVYSFFLIWGERGCQIYLFLGLHYTQMVHRYFNPFYVTNFFRWLHVILLWLAFCTNNSRNYINITLNNFAKFCCISSNKRRDSNKRCRLIRIAPTYTQVRISVAI